MSDERLTLAAAYLLAALVLVAVLVAHTRPAMPRPACWEDEAMMPTGPAGHLRCTPLDNYTD